MGDESVTGGSEKAHHKRSSAHLVLFFFLVKVHPLRFFTVKGSFLKIHLGIEGKVFKIFLKIHLILPIIDIS